MTVETYRRAADEQPAPVLDVNGVVMDRGD